MDIPVVFNLTSSAKEWEPRAHRRAFFCPITGAGDVRFWLIADFTAHPEYFRSTPESRHHYLWCSQIILAPITQELHRDTSRNLHCLKKHKESGAQFDKLITFRNKVPVSNYTD